jgi:hypothetical protein
MDFHAEPLRVLPLGLIGVTLAVFWRWLPEDIRELLIGGPDWSGEDWDPGLGRR